MYATENLVYISMIRITYFNSAFGKNKICGKINM